MSGKIEGQVVHLSHAPAQGASDGCRLATPSMLRDEARGRDGLAGRPVRCATHWLLQATLLLFSSMLRADINQKCESQRARSNLLLCARNKFICSTRFVAPLMHAVGEGCLAQ
eukprot:1158020-Pelagomonas_calceolata.AAC.1